MCEVICQEQCSVPLNTPIFIYNIIWLQMIQTLQFLHILKDLFDKDP